MMFVFPLLAGDIQYTPVTQSILNLVSSVYVATKQYSKLNKNHNKLHFFYYTDKCVTLKQGQSHQTWYELVDPKQDYNRAKLEDFPQKCLRKSQYCFFFAKSKNT